MMGFDSRQNVFMLGGGFCKNGVFQNQIRDIGMIPFPAGFSIHEIRDFPNIMTQSRYKNFAHDHFRISGF